MRLDLCLVVSSPTYVHVCITKYDRFVCVCVCVCVCVFVFVCACVWFNHRCIVGLYRHLPACVCIVCACMKAHICVRACGCMFWWNICCVCVMCQPFEYCMYAHKSLFQLNVYECHICMSLWRMCVYDELNRCEGAAFVWVSWWFGITGVPSALGNKNQRVCNKERFITSSQNIIRNLQICKTKKENKQKNKPTVTVTMTMTLPVTVTMTVVTPWPWPRLWPWPWP